MPIDYAALRTEFLTDPNAYGYAPHRLSGNDTELANLINRVRASISIPRPDIQPIEILEAIKITDFVANANNLMAAWFESICQFPSVRILKTDGTDTRAMTNFMSILANNSQSEARLRSLASRNGSRAEQLFGVNTFITTTDVALARGESW